MDKIIVLDFGSQYNQLIVRRIREMHVLAELHPHTLSADAIREIGNVKGIVFSGGPSSVDALNAKAIDEDLFTMGIPILGICYGMQLMSFKLGGKVERSLTREYGFSEVHTKVESSLFKNIPDSHNVWMSHGDHVTKVPHDFIVTGESTEGLIASFEHIKYPLYGVQYHPEVKHSVHGQTILENFVLHIAKAKTLWTMTNYIDDAITLIRDTVKDKRVLLGLSGGVDSSVAAVLIDKAIGKQLTCVYVDHGLMREGESEEVMDTFKGSFAINIHKVDAQALFLSRLKDVSDPEVKRKIIGNTFVEVFEQEARKIGDFDFLAQGTLYTDIIESGTLTAQTIKSHHNVGGLPEAMDMRLLEPLKELFKDEVRVLGRVLGLPDHIVNRQPFPGPGLAIRIIGDVTEEKVDLVKRSDSILRERIKHHHLDQTIWQYFTVLTPLKTVGVMGDERTYEHVLVIRAVTSVDGMTAEWAKIPHHVLDDISRQIVNKIKGISRVVYDITSKPPATIEWE